MEVVVDGTMVKSVEGMLSSIQLGLELPNSIFNDYPEVVVQYGRKTVSIYLQGEVEDKFHSLFGTFSKSQWEDIFS